MQKKKKGDKKFRTEISAVHFYITDLQFYKLCTVKLNKK
jgi:hypothetical protein